MRVPTFWRAFWYLVLLAALTLVTVIHMLIWTRGTAFEDYGFDSGQSLGDASSHRASPVEVGTGQEKSPPGVHPIEYLMSIATKQFDKVQRNEIHSLAQAAAQYRKLRGRHPPPGFDAWYTYAASHNAVINERFWDQIYHDLAPFWSLDPTMLRKQAHAFSPKIEIRGGKVTAKSYNNHDGKMAMWVDMLTVLAEDLNVKLPDIDMPLNINDEPAMLVPWESIDTATSMGRKMIPEPKDTLTRFSGLDDIKILTADYNWKPEWLGPRLTHPASHLGPRPLWSLIKPACPPGSAARLEKVFDDVWDSQSGMKEEHSAAALLPSEFLEGRLKGYVKNWSQALDACQQPHLQGLHSAFVAPKEMGIATKLFPLFGDTKFSMSNEILLPRPRDWNVSGSSALITASSWNERENKLHWRGQATTSRDSKRYWHRFQTERLVSMMNATQVEIAEASIHSGSESTIGVGYAKNFKLLPANQYHIKAQTGGRLAEWVDSWANAALEDLGCEENRDGDCKYIGEYFSPAVPATPTHKWNAKYGVSIDSTSDSLMNHLQRGHVILHASIYRNWYDSRLIPWLHFVPVDNTFVDFYGIIEYFLGSSVSAANYDFAHAVGEVQKHDEHHFNMPEGVINRASVPDHSSSKTSNEPHPSHNPPLRRADDEAARRLATDSTTWAKKVLRHEDVIIYVYRLLLEYARVVDAKRDRLGWVGDLG